MFWPYRYSETVLKGCSLCHVSNIGDAWPMAFYSSLFLSYFLSVHTLNNEIFVRDFCETVQSRVDICGIQIDDDIYDGVVNQPSPA